jgi:hypothetical protein
MTLNKNKWLTISLVNLTIVAVLGLVLRSKILFSIPFLDFKSVLHAHSHFAFGGWITLALLTLLAYELLPAEKAQKKIYNSLLTSIWLCTIGILVSFLYQGYGALSITFSTIFIFITYAFAIIFCRDMLKSGSAGTVKLLSISALIFLAISSVGPFTLAYLLVNKIPNTILYKDAIYTYLHLQYNGFFTLSVFALLYNKIATLLSTRSLRRFHTFSVLIVVSVIPSMFLSYLWHYPQLWLKIVAVIGCASMVACTFYFLGLAYSVRTMLPGLNKQAARVGVIAMTAFVLKMIFQSLTMIPALGPLVFSNRPIIIGFLHMVLLGFVSIYLLAHYIQTAILGTNRYSMVSVWIFCTGVIMNELVLMFQGLEGMFMISSSLFPKLLWATGAWLLIGALMILAGKLIKGLALSGSIKPQFSNISFK